MGINDLLRERLEFKRNVKQAKAQKIIDKVRRELDAPLSLTSVIALTLDDLSAALEASFSEPSDLDQQVR